MNSKPRILFVDDEPNFLQGIKRILRNRRHQWDLFFASSVDEALALLAGSEFDLVVTDVTMPKKNGFDLLQAVCAGGPFALPVIVLTGNMENDLKRRALELGAADLLNKPVNHHDLVARLTSTLRMKSYQDEIKSHNEILERKVAERTADLEVSRMDILWRLAKAGEYRDEETGNHTLRVGLFCRTIAEALGQSKTFCETIFLTSPLHDLGKIGIPDGILLKKGKLTPAEWKIMRTHCTIGASILKDEAKAAPYFVRMRQVETKYPRSDSDFKLKSKNHLLETAATIALSHHERWDGRGYPRSLTAEAIPLEARIVAIADVYDALKSFRPYKPAFPDEKVYAIIREEKGGLFDPRVVEAFETSLDSLRMISRELIDKSADTETDPVCLL